MSPLPSLAACAALVLPVAPPAQDATDHVAAELTPPQPAAAPQEPTEDRFEWFRDARFGLFLHWGLYSCLEGEWNGGTDYGEWIRTSAQIPLETYDELVQRFDPQQFDADRWMALAHRAGMRYVVITTKHHDGFCLFDSAQTDFDVMSTPWKRDIMADIAQAARANEMRVGWYHSIMDWHHPDYLPRRTWETDRTTEGADFDRYVAYLHAQVTELLSNYGPVDVMWFDGEWEATWTHELGVALYDLCRSLQPSVLVNNRVDKGRGGMAGMTTDQRYVGDFGTPEQEVPAAGLPGVDWESCITMNRHWGWNRADTGWKSNQDLVRMLVDVASKGGNLLLNIGPRPDGTFPPLAIERLEALAGWMDVHGEAIHGTQASPLGKLPFGRCTVKPHPGRTTLYMFVYDWPAEGELFVPNLGGTPTSARVLGREDAQPLATRASDEGLFVAIGAGPADPLCSVVALEFDGAPVVYEPPTISAACAVFVHPLEVAVGVRSPGLTVRYTTDGSAPTTESPVADGSFRIDQTTIVRARSFVGERPVASESRLELRRVEPRPGQAQVAARPGVTRWTYDGDWDDVPELQSYGEGTVVPRIALDEKPGEHVAHLYRGLLAIHEADVYEFALESDDGSLLSIAGEVVVDNGGLHGAEERIGHAALGAGFHPLEVRWFNKTGGAELRLRMRRIGGEWSDVQTAVK